MGRSDIGATVGRTADDHGDIDKSTRHVANTAGVVDDLIKADIGKAPEHQLHHLSLIHI